MDFGVSIDADTHQAWIKVAHGARLADRALSRIGDPTPGSAFDQVNALYRWEKASDWHRAYAGAALERLVLWADLVAQLRFDQRKSLRIPNTDGMTEVRTAGTMTTRAVSRHAVCCCHDRAILWPEAMTWLKSVAKSSSEPYTSVAQ